MSHSHFIDPDFDLDLFRSSVSEWVAVGLKQIVIEWQTGPGPIVVWYPAGKRNAGKSWRFNVQPTQYGEQYADYMEHRLMPKLADAVRAIGGVPSAICADQQPILVMRMRRRELEHAELASK